MKTATEERRAIVNWLLACAESAKTTPGSERLVRSGDATVIAMGFIAEKIAEGEHWKAMVHHD